VDGLTVGAPRLPTYAVISPVRDEAVDLGRTAACLLSQFHRPAQWVIVDDGSTDDTRAIAESLATDHEWISVLDSGAAHRRSRGGAIVRAFDVGVAELRARPEITVKLDGDVFLSPQYFAWVAETFARDPRAGIVGGVVLIHDGSRWRPDGDGTHHVNGVAKAYRTACLEEIGGLRPAMGWDGIDEYAAVARGWHVAVLTELSVLHYRRRGSKMPWYRARWEEGRGNHYMGYGAGFLLVRALFRMIVEDPPVAGGLMLAAGFFHARLTRAPQVDDPGAMAMLRREQRARLRPWRRRGPTDVVFNPLAGDGPAFWAPPDPAVPGNRE
jgi:biofilm PGA synthesis N-glycosyltransferase PgaC